MTRVYVPVACPTEASRGRNVGVRSVPIDILDVSLSETYPCIRAAMRVNTSGGFSQPQMTTFLAYDGAIWRPSHAAIGHRKPISREDLPDAAKSLGFFQFNGHPLMPTLAGMRSLAKRSSLGVPVADIDVALSTMAVAVEHCAKSTIMVDGDLYMRSAGPVLSPNGIDSELHWNPFSSRLLGSWEQRVNAFTVDRQEEAIAFHSARLGRQIAIDPDNAPEVLGEIPDQSASFSAASLESAAWACAWIFSHMPGDKMTPAIARALADLRGALSKRAPLDTLTIGRNHGQAWPYEDSEMLFRDPADLADILTEIHESGAAANDWHARSMVTSAVLRHRLFGAAAPVPESDLDALDGPRP